MKTLGDKFLQNIGRLSKSAFLLISVLIFIRLAAVAVNLQKNLGDLWIANFLGISSFSPFVAMAGFWLIFLIFASGPLKQASLRAKSWLAGYIVAAYLLLAAAGSLGTNFFISWVKGNASNKDLFDILFWHSFFDYPFALVAAGYMMVATWFCLKKQLDGLLLPLLSLPFFMLPCNLDDSGAILTFSFFVSAAFASRLRNPVSPTGILAVQALLLISALYFLFGLPTIALDRLVLEAMLIAIFLLSGFVGIRMIGGVERNGSDIALSWFVLPLGAFFLVLIANEAVFRAQNFTRFFAPLLTFTFAGNVIIPVLLVTIVGAVFLLRSEKAGKTVFWVLSLGLTALYVADAALFYHSGLRLDWETVVWSLNMEDFSVVVNTLAPFIDAATILSFMLLILIMYGIRAKATKLQLKALRLPVTPVVILLMSQISVALTWPLIGLPMILKDPSVCFIESIRQVKIFAPPPPEFNQLAADFAAIGFPMTVTSSPQPETAASARPNIIMVFLESTHWRYLSMFDEKRDRTWPQMAKLKDRLEIWPLFFCNFPESANADFGIISGLYPPDYKYFLQVNRYPEITLPEILHAHGYRCAIFSSQSIFDGGIGPFTKLRPFENIFDPHSTPDLKPEDCWIWGVKEHAMIKRLLDYFSEKTRESDDPWLIHYRSVYPHTPFDNLGFRAEFAESGENFVGRYKNALLYQDDQLYRLIKTIDEMKLPRETYFVLVGDHGTMLGEVSGYYGHVWNASPDQMNVPFMIVHPRPLGLKVHEKAGSQVDILPTVLELLQLTSEFKLPLQGRSLFNNHEPRPIALSSMRHRVLIENGYYYRFTTGNSSNFSIYQIRLDGEIPSFNHLSEPMSIEAVRAAEKKIGRFFTLQDLFLKNYHHYFRTKR